MVATAKAVAKKPAGIVDKPKPKPTSTVKPADKPADAPSDKAKPSKKVQAKKVTKGAIKVYKKSPVSFDNKFAPRQRPIKSVVTYRHILVAEFWVGIILILTKPDPGNPDKVGTNQLIETSAFVLTEAILFGVTASGRQGARIAVGFSTLILLTLATRQAQDGRWTKTNTPAPTTISGNGSVAGQPPAGTIKPPASPGGPGRRAI